MSLSKRSFIVAGVAVAAGFLYQPMRNFGDGLLLMLRGQRTVGNVLAALAPRMPAVFPQLDQLVDGAPLALLAFKHERILEVWKQTDGRWTYIKRYPFTGFSGELGPKLREGDRQIPEGEYRIEYLNPNSAYHLSMKLDYPNAFDREKATLEERHEPGSDIMIHGNRMTVGCIPIGDEAIEEVFYLVAKNGFKQTSVVVSPVDFRAQNDQAFEVDSVTWEKELYQGLRKRLADFPLR